MIGASFRTKQDVAVVWALTLVLCVLLGGCAEGVGVRAVNEDKTLRRAQLSALTDTSPSERTTRYLRHWALAEAARCFLKADQPDAALDLQRRLEAEAPDLMLPDHLRSRLKELGASNPS